MDAAHLIIVRCILPRHVQNQIRSTRVVLQELSHIKNTASDEQPHRLLSLVLLDLLHCVRLPLILLVRLRRLFRRLEGESGRWRVEVRGVGTQSTRRYALSLRHTPFLVLPKNCCSRFKLQQEQSYDDRAREEVLTRIAATSSFTLTLFSLPCPPPLPLPPLRLPDIRYNFFFFLVPLRIVLSTWRAIARAKPACSRSKSWWTRSVRLPTVISGFGTSTFSGESRSSTQSNARTMGVDRRSHFAIVFFLDFGLNVRSVRGQLPRL